MNEVETEALGWIERHQVDLVVQLQRLVSVPSVVGSEGECQQVVAELLRGPCDSVDVWEPDALWLERHPAYSLRGTTFTGRPNVVGVVKGRGGGRALILNAHVDVVDPGPPDAWQYAPWSGAIAEGSLYGRGAADDKASLASILFVAQCLRGVGVALAGDLVLQSVIDEEWGGAGTLSTIHRGYRADAAIVFEPSGLDICPASRGGQAFRITVTGKGAHPIRSYEGVSALEKALPILRALRDLEQVRQERLRTALFERYPIFAPIVKEGARIPVDHPLVTLMSASFRDVMERQPTIAGFPAGCDLPFLQKYGGMPGLVFGPGNCTLAHGSNEHVPIQEVVDAAKVVAIAVLRWCGTQQALARGTPGLAR